MPKCSYCGKEYGTERGLTLVDSATGKISYLCSSKCRKNSKIRKNIRKVRWIRKKKKEIL